MENWSFAAIVHGILYRTQRIPHWLSCPLHHNAPHVHNVGHSQVRICGCQQPRVMSRADVPETCGQEIATEPDTDEVIWKD